MNTLNLFVLYKRPLDYPEHFVVRRWENDKPTHDVWLADTLEGARGKLPPGLYRLARDPGDDPVIVETWI